MEEQSQEVEEPAASLHHESSVRRLRYQRLSCSVIPEEQQLLEDSSKEHYDDAEMSTRASSWHHPERPVLPYELFLPQPGLYTAASRRESFRSISHDSIIGHHPWPMSHKLITDEELQDWVLAAAKLSRNALTHSIFSASGE